MTFLKKLRFLPITLLLVSAFISCDDDYNSIGGELIGGEMDSLPNYQANVRAYSKRLGPVQTNSLSSNLLGVYKDPVYGQQIANILTQVSLSSAAPEFGENAILDSVVLTLPYFNTALEADESGNAVYQLDSIFGDAPFKLSITRSNYFLNDFDPEANFETSQKYYSNQASLFENNLIGEPLYVNETFKPSAQEVVYFEKNDEGETDTIRKAPRLRVNLPVQFFQDNIINKEGSSELSNNNNFKNFIRGLYFKAAPVNENGEMLLLDMSNADAGITLFYSSDPEDDSTERVQGSYKINLGPNRVNTFSEEFPAGIEEEIAQADTLIGSENLYLKGGAGSIAVIKLFEDEAELEELRSKNWLINEANLTFYVNKNEVDGGVSEPERIYLYNLETNTVLVDYQIDQTGNTAAPVNSKIIHSGRLVRDEDENGVSYKIKITQYISNLLNDEDLENVKLGLVVTQNINDVANVALKTPINGISRVPRASVMSPEGTVLHGNLATDSSKRLKLNIYYTETNN
ncbi:DUF4270 domain-containing protein [Gillisia sp. M10.2A]|uniref:DUF4270 domain-containing protein n=1 Tax=Gillisia lutea TaxID=2909668 RepID=A0ABS9EC57_9FLAO|nr:DUF4270 domain-containing protein [Gillisia lutea]MCF4100476.1 DUF4270 domain-containing protein [Gillisia lutea]